MLTITDLTLRIAGRTLLENASLSIPAGAKAGLVGRNGTGKTTLFKAITGVNEADGGTISIPAGMRMGQVAQEAPGTQENLIEIVLAGDLERTRLLKQLETVTDGNEIANIQLRLNDIDAYSAEARAATILAGLGFDQAAQMRPVGSFSGGWRMRVALAAVLFSSPDLLLLDEPTNYLDLEGTIWLENFVTRYPHTVLLISHDRDLLTRSVNSIVHLENQQLTYYKGDYDTFERTYAERSQQLDKLNAKQADQRQKMEAFVNRFRAKASKAKQAQSRLKALAKLPPVESLVQEGVQPIRFPEPTKEVASPAIALQGVSVGYPEAPEILRGLNLRIDADDRIALLGSNGNGKSTFAKMIADRLKATGEIVKAPSLKTAFFAQHQIDDLRPEESAYEHVRRAIPDAPESRVRAAVAQMGLATHKMNTAAKSLSGGEKARLLMGLAALDNPNLLILDEPTNHLDIPARRSLIDALNGYSGAVILISHDTHLIEATMDRLWLVEGGTIAPFEGDMSEYRNHILSTSKGGKSKKESGGPKVNKAEQRKLAAAARAAQAEFRKKVTKAEGVVERANAEIAKMEEQLADPKLYEGDNTELQKLTRKRAELGMRLAKAEEEWMKLSEELEAMKVEA